MVNLIRAFIFILVAIAESVVGLPVVSAVLALQNIAMKGEWIKIWWLLFTSFCLSVVYQESSAIISVSILLGTIFYQSGGVLIKNQRMRHLLSSLLTAFLIANQKIEPTSFPILSTLVSCCIAVLLLWKIPTFFQAKYSSIKNKNEAIEITKII